MPPIPFATQSYKHDSLPISAQRLVNMYAEAQPQGAKSQVTVHGSPGISTFATAGVGPIRGFKLFGGVLYTVSGGWLYSISNDPTPVATQLGGEVTGTGIVSMDDNGEEIIIVNGENGYLYNTSAGFTPITDADFNSASTVAYHSGYFLLDWIGTNKVFQSDLLDGSSYNALAFVSKEAKSDFIKAVLNSKEVLHFLGTTSSELWGFSGAANVPFQRIATIDRGVIAPHATAQEDQGLFLIGDDRMAYRVAGAQLSRISTHAIEQVWRSYTETDDAFGFAFNWRGHKFIAFTFPSQEIGLGDTATWVHDLATGLWHEKLSYDMSGNPLGRWRANCAIEAYGKVLIGDAFSGKIGYLDPTVTTEFDDPMYARAVSPPYHAGDKSLFTSRLTIDLESGVGISSGQGSDPQIMLDISDDGGRTFTEHMPWASMGALGQYKTRVKWDRLGRTEPGGTRVFGLTISDPVKRTIIAAHADMKSGM